jgi:hypothetical protein
MKDYPVIDEMTRKSLETLGELLTDQNPRIRLAAARAALEQCRQLRDQQIGEELERLKEQLAEMSE